MSKIRFNCPKCGKEYNIKEQVKGAKIKCAQCANIFLITSGVNFEYVDQENKPVAEAAPVLENKTIPAGPPIITHTTSTDIVIGFKQKMERHFGLFVAGLLISGFISGVFAYSNALSLFRYEIVTKDRLDLAEKENKELRESVTDLRKELVFAKRLKAENISDPMTENDRKILEEKKQKQAAVGIWGVLAAVFVLLFIIGIFAH